MTPPMRGISAAPLLALAGAFFLGISLPGALGANVPAPVSAGVAILLLAGMAGCARRGRLVIATALLAVAALAAGVANRPTPSEQGPLAAAIGALGDERLDRPIRLAGTLTRSPEEFSDRTELRLRVKEVFANRRTTRAPGLARIRVEGEHRHRLRGLARGADVEVWTRVARRRPPGNPGGRSVTGPVGLFGRTKSALLVTGERPAAAFSRLIRRLRLGIRDRFTGSGLSPEAAAVIVAILTGDRTLTAGGVVRSFRDAGTLHVMAVSGLHVGLVSLLLYGLFVLFGTGRRTALTLLLILLPFHAALSGGSPSVLRAALMAAVVILGIRHGIAGSALNGIGLAAILLLAWDPWNASDVGFQLSFAATLAIVGVLGRRDPASGTWDPPGRLQRLGRWSRGALAVTLAAQLGAFPVIAWHFHRVVLAAIPVSVPATLLAGPILGCGFGWLLLGDVPILGSLLLVGAGKSAEALLAISAWGAALPFATSGIAAPGWPFLAAWFALALVVLAVRSRLVRAPAALALVGLAAFLLPRGTAGDGSLRVTALDVGMGDALVLGLPAGGTVVVDAGAAYRDYSAGERVVAPFLLETGGLPVRAAVATHGDLDHIGGFASLFREVAADSFWRGAGLAADERPAVRFLRRDISRREIPARLLRTGEEFAFGGAWFRVLFADVPVAPGTNEGSLVLMVEYAGARVLLTGDAGEPTERILVEQYGEGLAADVLKVGHHGSRYSTTPEFLDAVRPGIAIVSAREDRRRRLPDPAVLERLADRGARVFRTDRDGAVTVRIGPDGALSVRAYRSPPP